MPDTQGPAPFGLTMSEISCRMFALFEAAERGGGPKIDALIAGLPVTRSLLENPRERVSWELFSQVTERFAEGMTPEEVENSGALVIDSRYLGPMLELVGLVADPRELYRVGARWFGPSNYRGLRFTFRDLPMGAGEFVVEIPEPMRPCEPWLRMGIGSLRSLPKLLGQPPASVVVEELTPRRLRAIVHPPGSRTLGGFVRRTRAAFVGARAITEELAEQQARLAASYAAQQRAERGFRSVLDALPIAVAVHAGGLVCYASPAFVRLVGGDDPTGRPLSELVVEGDGERLAELVLAQEGVSAEELRLIVGASGDTVPVEASALRNVVFDGARAGLFFAIDLSARRAAETALEQSEDTNRALLQVLPDLLLWCSKEGRILDVRVGSEHSDARLLERLVGTDVFGLTSALPNLRVETITEGFRLMQEAIHTGELRLFEFSSDVFGPQRDYECRFLPRESREVLVIVRDVTARKAIERQLAISERMATVGSVAAGVAHEINNPLTFIVANVGLALEELDRAEQGGTPPDPVALRQLLSDARSGADRVQRIAGDLRMFARAADDEQRHPTDLRVVVDSAIQMTITELRQRARIVRIDDGSQPVLIDASRLAQVFANLLRNAAQAIAQGAPESNEIRVRFAVEGARQLVEISDTGVGIAAQSLPHVFEPFYTTTSPGLGTGLGLSLCQRFVTQVGGEIEVRSELGVGSTFRVLIPLDTARASTVAPAPAAETGPSEPARILIVDDEPMVARALKRALHDHDVHVAGSGAQALEELARGRFDLVLCDVTMPGLGGLEVRARAEPLMRDRFLFITGGALTPAVRDAMEEHPDRFLAKPINLQELRAAIASELARVGTLP